MAKKKTTKTKKTSKPNVAPPSGQGAQQTLEVLSEEARFNALKQRLKAISRPTPENIKKLFVEFIEND
jgi:hypothetical protein